MGSKRKKRERKRDRNSNWHGIKDKWEGKMKISKGIKMTEG